MKLNNLKNYAPILVRVGVSLVFLWFGINQVLNTADWVQWVPSWAYNLQLSISTIVYLDGVFKIVFGLLLIIGKFVRISSLLLSLNLLTIIIGLGYNDIAIRDFGLMLATFSVFLYGPDKWSWDNKKSKK